MATKSILKNINVRGHGQVRRLADAMEKAENFKGKPVAMSHTVTDIKGEQIKEFIAEYLNGKTEQTI